MSTKIPPAHPFQDQWSHMPYAFNNVHVTYTPVGLVTEWKTDTTPTINNTCKTTQDDPAVLHPTRRHDLQDTCSPQKHRPYHIWQLRCQARWSCSYLWCLTNWTGVTVDWSSVPSSCYKRNPRQLWRQTLTGTLPTEQKLSMFTMLWSAIRH